MTYLEIEASPELAPWVAAYWHFRVAAGAGEIEHRIPLTGGAFLSFAPGPLLAVIGPRTAPLTTTVRGGQRYWGAHFWPGAVRSLLALGDRSLRDETLPAALAVSPRWAGRLSHELAAASDEGAAAAALDAALLELVPAAAALDEPVMTAVFRILASRGRAPLAGLAAEVGLSPRQLRRRFRRAADLSAKELSRIERLRGTTIHRVTDEGRSWVDLAAEHGYADQAHLVREFRSLVGQPPVAFAGHLRRIAHGRLLR